MDLDVMEWSSPPPRKECVSLMELMSDLDDDWNDLLSISLVEKKVA